MICNIQSTPVQVVINDDLIQVNFANVGPPGATGPQGQAGGAVIWQQVEGAFSFVTGNGYIANNSSLVPGTLPLTAAVGDSFTIVGKGAGGWQVAQNAGQTIHFGDKNTTTGTGGSVMSQSTNDAMAFICTTANTDFTVLTSQGNLTLV